MKPELQTLKFQIVLALGLLVALFTGAILYTLSLLDQQRSDDLLVRLAGELQLTQQHLTMQAMNYKDNAPRDYPTYYRDVRLYYQDLIANRSHFDRIVDAFAKGRFDRELTGARMYAQPGLDYQTRQAALELQAEWQAFSTVLDEKLGSDRDEPRLEWAAEWVLEENARLEQAATHLQHSLQSAVDRRANQATLFGRLMMVSGLAATALILLWFYLRVLRPLHTAVRGFQTVATGDFSHRVPITADNEIGWMIQAFNQMSGRLDALRNLITRLQEARTLEETLAVVSETLPGLVPLDWAGILVKGPDGRMHLQQAYNDGRPEQIVQQAFELQGTLLEECVNASIPLHVASVRETSLLDPHYKFLDFLHARHREEAVFMPITGSDPIVGVAVFASRVPNTYRNEHISLLYNLSHLFSVSFGRTVTLMESARLATIGQFASGIVHEVRNPLATINLALEHFAGQDNLADSSRKRCALALDEVVRLSRLLDDILLYAKPMQLHVQTTCLAEVFAALGEGSPADSARVDIDTEALNGLPMICIDTDRFRQVLLNLLNNAIEANGDDPRGVRITASSNSHTGTLTLEIENGGEPIAEDRLERLFEPFYTSKSSGTGLGLPIVKRIVEAHGGEIRITSNTERGTRTTVQLPLESG